VPYRRAPPPPPPLAPMSDSEDSGPAEGEAGVEAEAEEVDSEEADELSGRRKKKRPRRSRFLDDEAADDDDEEDEEDGDAADLDGFLADDKEESVEGSLPSRRRQRLDAEVPLPKRTGGGRGFLDYLNTGNVHDLVAGIKLRAAEQERVAVEDGGQTSIQEACYPSLSDPKMFMVKIRGGMGRELCMKLMNKAVVMAQAGTPLGIKSVVAVDHLKDYIYIEAYKADFVLSAVAGITGIYRSKLMVVPIKEMVPIFHTSWGAGHTGPGKWARMRRAECKGDLCQVMHYDPSREMATVRMIPRIDIQAIVENTPRPSTDVRLPKRLFRAEDVHKYGGKLDLRPPYTYFHTMRFDSAGYLVRDVTLTQIQWKDVTPSIEEIQAFTMGEPIAAKLLPPRKVIFKLGDVVRITTGTEKGMKGQIIEIKDSTYVIRADSEYNLATPLLCSEESLAKHFREGEHVRCIQGAQAGLSGMIVFTEGDKCTLFADVTREEVTVFMNDVEPATEEGVAGESKAGRYQLGDLVRVDAQIAGVILRIEKDQLVLLNHNGMPKTVRLQDIKGPVFDKNVHVEDSTGCPVSVQSPIRVVTGEFKGKYAVVEHLYRSVLFCRARDVLENNGLFVVAGLMTIALGGEQKRRDAMKLPTAGVATVGGQTPASPALFTKPPTYIPGLGLDGGKGKGKGKGDGKGGKGRANPNSWMERLHCVVTRGVYKAFRGRVVQTTETEATVELHTNEKVITIPIGHLRIVDPKAPDRPVGSATPVGHSALTPALSVGRTPMYNMATPLYAPDTPLSNFEEMVRRSPSVKEEEDPWRINPLATSPVHSATSPVAVAPRTPTPAGSASRPSSRAYWCLPGTVVQLLEQVEDPDAGALTSHPAGTVAVVLKVVGDTVDVVAYDRDIAGARLRVPDVGLLEPVQVREKNQKCIVTGYKLIDSNTDIRDKLHGSVAEMLGESGDDQIIQLSGGMDIAVVKRFALARYVPPDSFR